MNKKYAITVREELSRTIVVEAPSYDAAYEKVEEEYRNLNIVLDKDRDRQFGEVVGDEDTLAEDGDEPDYIVE